MHYTCHQCGRDFDKRFRSDRTVKFCSNNCYGRSRLGSRSWNRDKPAPWMIGNRHAVGHTPWNKGESTFSGERNPRWKGGRWQLRNGYVLLKAPNHPKANSRGYVYEHVLLAEESIGRFLRSDEVAHHINEVKSDNRVENLSVLNAAEHRRLHVRARNRLPNGRLS